MGNRVSCFKFSEGRTTMNNLRVRYLVACCFAAAVLISMAALDTGQSMAAPDTKSSATQGLPPAQAKPRVKAPPMSDQTIPGTPVRATARDSGSVGIFYNGVGQFYSEYAEGVYLWVNGQVWGP